MELDNNLQAFFALVRAGLWADLESTDIRNHGSTEPVNWDKIYQLAEDQSVIGVVLAGFERSGVKPPQYLLLQWIGEVQILEQQNKSMNKFIAEMVEKLREKDIIALLVKGQGIAQCYERPLWRQCGDIDFLMTPPDYERSKSIISLYADFEEPEVKYRLHKSYHLKEWEVELHGNMRGWFLNKVDRVIDQVQDEAFGDKQYRKWDNNGTIVLLPSIDNDIIFVFAHILQHFFVEGIGLRQICDWCRLLWTYKSEIDDSLLESRLRSAGMMSEWKAFAAFAVDYLGMPAEAMSLYSSENKWTKKANGILEFILKTGSFGRNRNINETYKYPLIVRKIISFFRHTGDGLCYLKLYPVDAVRIWVEMLLNGVKSVIKMAGGRSVA